MALNGAIGALVACEKQFGASGKVCDKRRVSILAQCSLALQALFQGVYRGQ
jgi:hypothetical protein